MTDVAIPEPRELGLRAQPTLRLALGYRDEARGGAPVKTDYFVAKSGGEGEYAAAADKFTKVCGPQPKAIDIMLPSSLGQALDIKHKAWAGGGGDGGGVLRAIGARNFAFEGHLGGPDTLTIWEPDGTVREQDISGVGDPVAQELGVKLYTVFRFHIPKVLGLTGWAEISTTSAKSTDNLYRQLRQLYGWLGPVVTEVVKPKLVLRKATARPIVIKDGKPKRIRSSFWALDLYVPDTIDEVQERLAARSALLPHPMQAALPPAAPEATLGGLMPPSRPTHEQHGALALLINELAEVCPVPDGGAESWEAWTRWRAAERFGVASRADLTRDQMAELLDEVDARLARETSDGEVLEGEVIDPDAEAIPFGE